MFFSDNSANWTDTECTKFLRGSSRAGSYAVLTSRAENLKPSSQKYRVVNNKTLAKMEKCCINGCDSHKNIGDKNIGYFQ